MLASGICALVLSACAPGMIAEASLRKLEDRDPDQNLAAVHRDLAGCGPTIVPPEWTPYLAAIAGVLEVERGAPVLYRHGGKAVVQSAISSAAAAQLRYPHLAARLTADHRALDRVEALEGKIVEEKWAEVKRLGATALADPAVARVIDPQLHKKLAEAVHQANEKEREREAEKTGALAVISEALGPIAGWAKESALLILKLLAPFALALAIASAALRASRKQPRYDISLYDHARSLSAPDELLKGQLLDELRLLSTESTVTAESAADLGTIAVAHSPGPVDQLQDIASKIDPSAVLGIGLVRVPLGTLWTWLSRAIYPPDHVWRGDISRHAGETRLELQMRQRKERASTRLQVRVPGVDEAALSAAIREMAYQVVHTKLKDPAKDSGTRSPKAFASFEAANALLARAGERTLREALVDARTHLERALAEDPDYFTARLRLANVVGRLGEKDLAAAMLADLARKHDHAHGAELRYEEARLNARFQDVVDVHLEGAGDYGRVRKALQLTRELLERKDLSPTIALNTHSLRATIAAALLTMLEREERNGEGERADLEGILEAELRYFDAEPPADMDRKAFALAGALARTANGKRLAETKSRREAFPIFRSVLIGHPDLLSALLGLAMAYRKAKPEGWFDQARPCLERAERLDPHSASVHYEFGSALEDRKPPDVEGAKIHFEKAAPRSPTALYKLGVLLAEEKHEPLVGLRHIFRAIEARGSGAPPFWTEKLAVITAGAAAGDPKALSLSQTAVRILLANTVEAGELPDSPTEAERADHASERRHRRRCLVRASEKLAEAITSIPAANLGNAKTQVRPIVDVLKGVEGLVASDRQSGDVNKMEEERIETIARHRTALEAML